MIITDAMMEGVCYSVMVTVIVLTGVTNITVPQRPH